jgi:cysteinyl-tRNA synthetase
MLKIYNTATKQKEVFTPLEKGKVSLYVCGMTVYDLCHLGHARSVLAFDTVYRYLTYRGFAVTHVRNITDIEDKIIHRANDNKENFSALTERMIQAMHEDFAKLGLLPPNKEPRATAYIQEMLAIIETLIKKDIAYVGKNGDVYYEISKFKSYGRLSNRDLEKMRAGERVEVAEDKRDPLDFVLWKKAKPNEPSWDSPWGKGRPGWHIECSAMSTKCLHEQIDIHGGGMDLLFPHHENEVAQTEAATGKKFVNTWMHVGFLQINDEKMSKSLGNFFTIREVLQKFHAETIRAFFLLSHYRSPFNYSEVGIKEAHASLERLYTALRELPDVGSAENTEYEARFIAAMDDDFNTSEALAVLFDMAREINSIRHHDSAQAAKLGALLKKLGGVLNILQQASEAFFKTGILIQRSDISDAEIEELIQQRYIARQQKNWTESDRIRDALKAKNIILEDAEGKTIWKRG